MLHWHCVNVRLTGAPSATRAPSGTKLVEIEQEKFEGCGQSVLSDCAGAVGVASEADVQCSAAGLSKLDDFPTSLARGLRVRGVSGRSESNEGLDAVPLAPSGHRLPAIVVLFFDHFGRKPFRLHPGLKVLAASLE